MYHFHCWLIFILYIACVNHFWFLVFFLALIACWMLSKCYGQFSLCMTLSYIAFMFNHWNLFFALTQANMWVCKFGSNVNGLCRSELCYSRQDPQALECTPPSILSSSCCVCVIFLIFFAFGSCVVSWFSQCHFMLCFSMLHYDNFCLNIDLKITFCFNLKLITSISI